MCSLISKVIKPVWITLFPFHLHWCLRKTEALEARVYPVPQWVALLRPQVWRLTRLFHPFLLLLWPQRVFVWISHLYSHPAQSVPWGQGSHHGPVLFYVFFTVSALGLSMGEQGKGGRERCVSWIWMNWREHRAGQDWWGSCLLLLEGLRCTHPLGFGFLISQHGFLTDHKPRKSWKVGFKSFTGFDKHQYS